MLESIDTYCDVLKDFIVSENTILIIGTLALLILGILASRLPEEKNQKFAIFGYFLLIIIIALWCIFVAVIPRNNDLKNKNIIIAENAVYYYDNTHHVSTKSVEPDLGTVKFTIDGVTRTGLAVFTHRDNLPEGTYNCTIVYAEESKVILDIIFYEEIETDEENWMIKKR